MIGQSNQHKHEKIESEYLAHLQNWSIAQAEFEKSTFTLHYEASPKVLDDGTATPLKVNKRDDKFSQIVASNHLPSYTNFNYETPIAGLPNGTVTQPLFGSDKTNSNLNFKLEATWEAGQGNMLDLGSWDVGKMKVR